MGRYQYLFYKLYLFLKDKTIFKEWIFISESHPPRDKAEFTTTLCFLPACKTAIFTFAILL